MKEPVQHIKAVFDYIEQNAVDQFSAIHITFKDRPTPYVIRSINLRPNSDVENPKVTILVSLALFDPYVEAHAKITPNQLKVLLWQFPRMNYSNIVFHKPFLQEYTINDIKVIELQ